MKKYWYKGYGATKLINNIYYVHLGCWSDQIYIIATKIINIPIFGYALEGIEVNANDVWSYFEENCEPSKEELAKVIINLGGHNNEEN